MKFIIAIFTISILIGMAHSTFIRNAVWKTGESIWLDAVEKYPSSPRAHHNLGRYYGRKGLIEEEMAEYLIALKLKRGSYRLTKHLTHYNIALIYLKKDQADKALTHFLKTIEIDPGYSDAYLNIGVIYMKKRQYDAALDYFTKSLTHNRTNAKANNNIGHILLKNGKINEAIHEFNIAIALKKDFSSALRGLGIAYRIKKDYAKSRHYFEKALKENRKKIITRLHLIETLLLMKDDRAMKSFLSETLAMIPPAKMCIVINTIVKGNFPYEDSPNLNVVLPILGKAYEMKYGQPLCPLSPSHGDKN